MKVYEIYYQGNVIYNTIAESEQSAVIDFISDAKSLGIKLQLYPYFQYELFEDNKMRIFYIHKNRFLGYSPTWSFKESICNK